MRIRLVLALSVLGLTSGVRASERVVLRVSGVGPSNAVTAQGVAETRVIGEFRRRFPHVDIQAAEGLKIEGLGDEIAPLMMIAGGISPDVLVVNFRKIDSYVQQGILYPLDDFIAQEVRKDPNWKKSRFLPQIEPVARRTGPDGREHYYALPMQPSVMGLYYNRLLFREAGLPPRAPRDWDELVEFAGKINALDSRNMGLLLGSGQQAAWNLMNFLWSTGGDAVKEVAPNEWQAVFNTPEALEAFEFYYRIVEGDRIAMRRSDEQMMKPGESRRVGMKFSYIGSRIAMDPSVWGFGAVPAGPSGIRGAEINADMKGIFSGVKDPRVRQAAWDFINFLSSEVAEKIRTDTFIEMGMASQLNPSVLRKYGYEEFLDLAEPGLEQEFQKAMDTAHPEPYGKNCNLVYVEMTYPLDQILLSREIAEAWKNGDTAGARAIMQRILDEAVRRTSERMLGSVSPGEMQKRRIVAWIVVAGMVVAFGFVGRAILRTFSTVGRATSRVRGVQKYYAWGLLAIPVLLSLTWQYLPLARGAAMAVLNYQLLLRSTFVGIDNFANVLFDPRFWGSLGATLHFAFWMLTAGFVLPILLAYLLHLAPKQKLLFRTIYYLPALLSGAAVFVLWKQFFSAQGLMNELLGLVGLQPQRAWNEDPLLAMLSCVIPAIWAGAGPGCLIYLAALKTIPEEQFEAAEIDGAGFWRKSAMIVFPGLKPLIIINFVGAVTGAFQSSQNVLIMTGGGPNGATEVAALRIFYEAFMFLHFGPATAMAWILGAMLIGFTLIQLRRLSRMEFRGGGR
ncbi:MAG: extracellular solute-binding protein [Chthoniobacterales bacterium]|nr:extracellular solute-binding protein [Chthoniobacterales bacterium]